MLRFQSATPAYLPYRLRKPSGPTPVIGCAANIDQATRQSRVREMLVVSAIDWISIGGGIVEGGGCWLPTACAWVMLYALMSPVMPCLRSNHVTFRGPDPT